mmetsp:Transcript_44578/g.60445  ORF Transcript_44578/g.60445 Transcript_44578/m.60445 type:complete len:120 (+) Transcript_44578:122-481(+)
MISEFKQMIATGLAYFLSAWNLLDVLPLIFVTVNGVLALVMPRPNTITVTFQSLAAISMWFKLIYFMRTDDRTGYLVRMIIEVAKDMVVFMLVLLITIIAYADAFYTLSNSQKFDSEPV